MARTCACGADLGKRNETGHCRPYSTRLRLCSPESQAKAAAGLRRYLANPLTRAAHAARSQASLAEWRQRNPEHIAELGRAGIKRAQEVLADPAAEAGRRLAIRRSLLAGIPEHRWEEYSALARQMPAAEARRIIADDEAAIERRRLAAMTPLERQLERVRKGARVVEVRPLRKSDHAFTLGGVSAAMP